MGIHDRDYMQAGPAPSALYRPGRLTWLLIAINGILWIVFSGALNTAESLTNRADLDASLFRLIENMFMLWPDHVFGEGRVWQLFTSFWLHDPASAQHVLFNMIALFFFGRVTETWLGPKRFLALYIGAGLFASLIYAFWSFAAGNHIPALGASGAVFAVMAWLALQQPKSTVYMMMVIPMPMWLAVGVFIIGLEVLQFAGHAGSAGSAVAHLAGAAFGAGFWFFARRFAVPSRGRRAPTPDRTRAPSQLEDAHRMTAMRMAVDALLAKVHEHGIHSLTPDEKAFLEQASRELGGR